MTVFWRFYSFLLDNLICLLFDHPPVTSFAWGGSVEATAERTARILAAKGVDITVNCCCGKRRVSPIWRPWFRR
jgi:hypothetical protein